MIDPSIEQLGGRVLAEAADIAAPDPRHAPGAREDEEPERAHAAEEVRIGSLARARLRCGQRVELEARITLWARTLSCCQVLLGFPELGSSPPPQRGLPSGHPGHFAIDPISTRCQRSLLTKAW